MKIGITSNGDNINAILDSRFGRCNYFAIYNTVSKTTEFIPNPNKDSEEGAGPASVQIIAAEKVSKVISGEFGMKIKPLLESLKIEMITIKDQNKKIKDLIEEL